MFEKIKNYFRKPVMIGIAGEDLEAGQAVYRNNKNLKLYGSISVPKTAKYMLKGTTFMRKDDKGERYSHKF